ncbi:MAG: ArnT family glycosyltransferase [Anaerolineales bacterium]
MLREKVRGRRRQYGGMILILLLALALRMGYIRHTPPGAQFENVDAQGYHWLARNLLEHGVYSMNTEPPLRAENVRAPLYPLWVAGWYSLGGPAPMVVVLSHALIDTLTVVLIYRLGRLVAGAKAGMITALLYALNPSSWRFCNELLTEIIFGCLLTAAVWMLARYIIKGRNGDAFACGVLTGAAILCKPNVQFLPLILVIIMVEGIFTGRKGWQRGALIVMVTIGALLMPWVVRNRMVFGQWFYTRTFDDNLAHVSAVATLARINGEDVAPWTARWEEIYDTLISQTAARYGWEDVPESTLSSRDRDERLQQITAVAGDVVRRHPTDFFASHTLSWARSFIPQEHKFWYTWLTGRPWESLGLRGDALGRGLAALARGGVGRAVQIVWRERIAALPPLALALWIAWGVGYTLAALLMIRGAWRLRPRVLTLMMLATIFYVTFVPGPISHIRFRLPVVPLLLLLMTCGIMTPCGDQRDNF